MKGGVVLLRQKMRNFWVEEFDIKDRVVCEDALAVRVDYVSVVEMR